MATRPARAQNKRGEGDRLRDEIVAAATTMLEETGNEEAITLRGVARRVGIAAPSIYGHFKDSDDIVLAVVAAAFADLDAVLARTDAGEADEHLRALCAAYLDFAVRQPHRYRVMFGRHRTDAGATITEPRPTDDLLGGRAFNRLLGAVADLAGTQPGAAAFGDATALWVALHGYASLRSAVPAFPWPDAVTMLDTLIGRLVQSTAGPGHTPPDREPQP